MIYTIDRVSFFIFTEQGPKHMKRGVNMERTMTRLEIVLGQLGQNDIAEKTEAAAGAATKAAAEAEKAEPETEAEKDDDDEKKKKGGAKK